MVNNRCKAVTIKLAREGTVGDRITHKYFDVGDGTPSSDSGCGVDTYTRAVTKVLIMEVSR